MNIVVHSEIPQDESLREQWNALVALMACPAIFFTYEWSLAVTYGYQAARSPLLILGYEGDLLRGVAALATPAGRPEVEFLTGTTADYCDFVCAPEIRSQFVSLVFAELRKRKVRSIALANLPLESAADATLASCSRKHGYHLFRRPAYRCAQVALSSPEQKDSVKRSLRQKKSLLRDARALAKIGPVALSHLGLQEPVAAALPDFFRAHVARFLNTGRISNLARPERRAFLDQLAMLLSRSGWMKFSCLSVGGKGIAWNYGFEFAGSWFWYQPTFDGRFQRYFPGFLLLASMLEEACERDEIQCLDLGLGTEEYKDRFANGSRQTMHVTVSRSWLPHAKHVLRFHAAKAVKSRPNFERWIRRVIARFSKLLLRVRSERFALSYKQVWKLLFHRVEVIFFERPLAELGSLIVEDNSVTLKPITLDLLADAAMGYSDEPETLAYLLRAAARLASGGSEGFTLLNSAGAPVHFCWVTKFADFYVAELDHRLPAPQADCALLFDCWTPPASRRRGYYRRTIAQVARKLQNSGKHPWIFSAETNAASVRGITAAGFEPRFSLYRRRVLSVPGAVHSRAAGSSGSFVGASSSSPACVLET